MRSVQKDAKSVGGSSSGWLSEMQLSGLLRGPFLKVDNNICLYTVLTFDNNIKNELITTALTLKLIIAIHTLRNNIVAHTGVHIFAKHSGHFGNTNVGLRAYVR
jgi:hypothetical protein